MNVFEIHRQIVDDYSRYIRSFINISDPEIEQTVEESLSQGSLWPQPLLQFNPAYELVGKVEDVIASGLLHPDLRHIFKGYSCFGISATLSRWVCAVPTSLSLQARVQESH